MRSQETESKVGGREAARLCLWSGTGRWPASPGSQGVTMRCILHQAREASGKVYLFCEAILQTEMT